MTPQERVWADVLAATSRQAADIGRELFPLRDRQTTDLADLETTRATLNTLLTGPVRAAHLEDAVYQEAVSGMHDDLRETVRNRLCGLLRKCHFAAVFELAGDDAPAPGQMNAQELQRRHFDQWQTNAPA